MNDTLRERMQAWRTQADALWRARAPRERVALAVAALVLIVLVVWALLVAPALATLRGAPQQLEALEAQLLQMRSMAAEVRELRNATPVAAAQSGLAIKAAAERHGDKVRLTLQSDRALVTLVNASPEQLRALLVEVRSAARARPVEADLTRVPAGYSGTLVFNIGGG
ncbi:MAG TPA: type II secretion system protein GspM [Burkholderiaceae bacterium]|nr:type II secretion system protein GspM [Burkholderiaceae bacterium]